MRDHQCLLASQYLSLPGSLYSQLDCVEFSICYLLNTARIRGYCVRTRTLSKRKEDKTQSIAEMS